jgi:hypothetical protein
MGSRLFLLGFLALSASGGPEYLVLVDPGQDGQFLAPANELAALHHAELRRFSPRALEETLAQLRKSPPRFVAFVLPPAEIDLELCHAILEMSTRVDDDPFPDFEYGFVTGRDGPAASRFVARIAAAWKREYGRRCTLFGTWGGSLPWIKPLTAARPLALRSEMRLLSAGDSEEGRRVKARDTLSSLGGRDALLFFSHGQPECMEGCFRAQELREWKVDLSPAILFNCACFNGAPARWWELGPAGVEEKRVESESAVALALLDSGICGYFAGIDSWHGPLSDQVFGYVLDDGFRLGEASKRMADRLALAFLPERIHFPPVSKSPERFQGEGVANRRWNAAGMIFYGDPALAPFSKNASRLFSAEPSFGPGGKIRVKLAARPLIEGGPGLDFNIATSRLSDYYSVRTINFAAELAPEIYRVIPLPAGSTGQVRLRVVSATSGERRVPVAEPQCEVETTPEGRFLHLRVPLAVRLLEPATWWKASWGAVLATNGLTVELEGEI